MREGGAARFVTELNSVVDVLGTVDGLAGVVEALSARGDRPQRLIVTKDNVDGAAIRRLFDAAAALGMTMARLPKLTDFKSGIGESLEVRPVAIEDLLGRPQTPLDRDAMRTLIEGRRVLITGAGGSIGSELVRQVSDFRPARLTLADNAEFNLYSIDMETAGRHPALPRRAVSARTRRATHRAHTVGSVAGVRSHTHACS